MSLVSELKRRNVFRVAVLYAVASWVLLQVGDLLFSALNVPPWGIRLLLGLLLLGFVPALIVAWVYELTPEGLKREHEVAPDASITTQTARKLDLTVIVLVVAAVALVGADRFLNHRSAEHPSAPASAVAGAAGTAATAISIAVLPFVNMSDDKSNEYFSDGLTEELLNVLANVQGLRVIARTSSFAYKGKEVKISDVARDLNVDNVLEGSVRKSGNRVRITTQLIRASDSSHVWSQTYDRNLDDVFALQDEISGQVVDALKVRLLRGGTPTGETGGTQVAAAYDAFLQGRYNKQQGEAEATLRKALSLFDDAIRLDPGYARAYVGRSDTLTRLAANGYEPFESTFKLGEAAAKKAIELAPELAEAYLSYANFLSLLEYDQQGAKVAARRALELNPGSFDVQWTYAQIASAYAEHEEAMAAARKAVELDPLSAAAMQTLASSYYYARRYDEAEKAARRALELEPGRTNSHAALGWVLLELRRHEEALAEFEKETVGWQRMTGQALVFARTGRPDLARAEMQKMHDLMGDAPSYQLAEISAQLGDVEGTFRWLKNARRVRDPGLPATALVDPLLDPVRKDPRFDALLRDIGLLART
jgi:TolB-like protein/tetratricopeptide (TPR) repeat protein